MVDPISTGCCIAGGGPAGMMLGFMLARAGVDVVVLEKHADFLRDFRGDTIHPSTLELMHELGLLDSFLALPHQQVERLGVVFGSTYVPMADFRSLPTACKFVAFMPQWDFLDFLGQHAGAFPNFRLMMRTEAQRLLTRDDRVTGLAASSPEGEIEIRAPLVVAADGRDSRLRAQSGLPVENFGAPMDVLWFRLARPKDSPPEPLGRFRAGRILVMIDRGDYWQCGYVIPKGSLEKLRRRGFDTFRRDLEAFVPDCGPEIAKLGGWDEVHLLTVQVNRLRKWYRPGFLCIGDAAHAMSPVGGVGINLAVQDAVAAANLLAAPLRSGEVTESDLGAVQRRRAWPAKTTQWMQLLVQNRVVSPALGGEEEVRPALVFRALARFPALRRIPARLIGMGARPEHVGPALAPAGSESSDDA